MHAREPQGDAVLEAIITVAAGAVDRSDALATAALAPQDMLFARTAGEYATVVTLTEIDGPEPGRRVPCQLAEGGRLTWLVAGHMPAGSMRRYRCLIERVRGGRAEPAAGLVAIRLAGDHVWFTRDGVLLARYAYLGTWKPYFWPVMVPAGNVVRGASGEHQHQTGLFLAYGGHGGEGTTNIWSDWDEPPYGPCGKMVHLAFELVEGGPVHGRLVQRVLYTKADGPELLLETRDVRLTPLPNGDLVFDIERRVEAPQEPRPGPFILAARVADSLRLVDLRRRDERGYAQPLERPGALVAAVEPVLQRPENATYRTIGPWLDWYGPVGDGIAGIAFFDHPANPGFGQGITAAGYGCMTLSHPFPEGAAGALYRYRVLAHTGDATQARIAQRYRDYLEPVETTLEVLRRPPPREQPH